MKSEARKVTKHRSTHAPFECNHCGLAFYGWIPSHREIPEATLCTKCGLALENYLWNKHNDFYCSRPEDNTDEMREQVQKDAQFWVQDKTKKPLPKLAAKRFHQSVPKWMRSAITAGMVKTNSEEVYVVYSRGSEAISVELVDRSTLKPFRIR